MKEQEENLLDEDIIEDVNLDELDEAKKKVSEEDDDCDDDDKDDDDKDDDDKDDDDDDEDEDLDEAASGKEDFIKWAEGEFKKVHGDKYNQEKADRTIEEILKKADDDIAAAKDMVKVMTNISKDEKNESVDYVADLANLVESDETLSEDFKDKAAIIFEAALTSKLREEAEKLQEEFDIRIVEETEKIRDSLSEKIDNYLTYAVESWVEDNKIAIESGLRTEVAESFIDALKNVFVEHYIEVPETKKDLVEELETKLALAEQALSATEEKANELNEQVEKLSRETIIAEATESLADTQGARLRKLVEDIEFVDEETFAKKVKTIKECYFKEKPATVIEEEDDTSSYSQTEVIVEEDEIENISPTMQKYVNTLSRINKASALNGR